jgi:hypothetical protein
MWKPEHRRAADRRGLRYPSDLTDAEWALIEPASMNGLDPAHAAIEHQTRTVRSAAMLRRPHRAPSDFHLGARQ